MRHRYDRKRVLISAFSISPHRGSEPGVGWNICTRLGQYHDVTALYGSDSYGFSCAYTILDYVNMHGPIPGVEFHPVQAPPFSLFCEFLHNHGLWAFYYLGYRAWQKKAYREALKLHGQKPFDLVHQLNMIGYREPGYLWKLDVPFVWGPVGGHAQMPLAFLPLLDMRARVWHRVRNYINGWQMSHSRRVRRAIRRADVLFAATRDDWMAIRRIHGRDAILLNETGTTGQIHAYPDEKFADHSRPLELLWAGPFRGPKALPLGLHAIARARKKRPNMKLRLTVIGDGHQYVEWKSLADHLGISDCCVWTGWLPHDRALVRMQTADAMLFTSLLEATSTVVPEALTYGIPVICHDACGFGDMVTNECGIKIPLTNPETSINGFADAILLLEGDRLQLEKLAKGAWLHSQAFTWEKKTETIADEYQRVLHKG